MIKVNRNGIEILEASEGMFLTQKDTAIDGRIFVKAITIVNGNDALYREATLKEKEDYEATLLIHE